MASPITYIIVIAIIFYIIWYITSHTNPATTSDLFTVWGRTLVIFTWLLSEAKKELKECFKVKLDAVEEKMNKFINSSKKSKK